MRGHSNSISSSSSNNEEQSYSTDECIYHDALETEKTEDFHVLDHDKPFNESNDESTLSQSFNMLDINSLSDLELQEHLQLATQIKEEANQLFLKQDYSNARKKYLEALTHCPNQNKQSAILFSNLAACDLKGPHWEQAISYANQAILIDPEYTKAYCKRAKAYEMSTKSTDLSKALEGNPSK
jgi:tetratricopeptide (TPR) repeat protein